jgi:very-short-patch-repair endonuclease
MDMDSEIAAIAARQLGLFTGGQARVAGATRSMRRHRLTRGRWVQVHADVFRLAGVPPSWEQSVRAACLAAGPAAVVSHRAAAQIWELPGVRPDIELTLPFGHDALLAGVRVHHSRLLPPVDVTIRDDMKVTTPTRTLIDMSSVLDRSTLQRVLDHCLGQRLTTTSFVTRRLESLGRQGRPGSALLTVLLADAARDGRRPESELERRLWELLRQLPGPPPVAQYEVRLPGGRRARLDIAYPDIRLAIEADSYAHHSSASDWASDHTRRNALIAAGWRILPVTWDDVSHDPDAVLELVQRARAGEGGAA